ncbi:TPA: cell division protein FtsK [Streptococcus agalactiae]|nr:cell division protein FtsK [Streptococcus agalactiae]HEN4303141.1 cell division protein FtsK [Streptococcus agalactiae]
MARLIPQYRGIKVRPYMRNIGYYLFSFLFVLLLIPLGFYVYQNLDLLKMLDKMTLIIDVGLLLFSIFLAYYLTWFLQEANPFFKKFDRVKRLSRFLYENGYVYEKKTKKQGKRKVKFPKVYLKQNKYDLDVSFEMAGGKFQEKFKQIGGSLEDTFFMDFMETTDDHRFKNYKLAYSAFLNRIKVSDVVTEAGKGLKLMKNLYWDYDSDPHMIIGGGTGGGKTTLLRAIIGSLATVGVVDICDPKRADFVTMPELSAFSGRVAFDKDDIVAKIQNALVIMMARYDFMRKERERLKDKDFRKYYEYGLEPYFFVCDEYNALMAMLDYKERDVVDSAIGQFLLLGRQAGCFGIIAMQKPAREDLGSKLQANINFRISVGRLDSGGYELLFGDANKNKEFKYIKYLSGYRIYGRGYASSFGEVAREFYSPLLEKNFVFYDLFAKIERHENQFDPNENNEISSDIVNDPELVDLAEKLSKGELPETVEDYSDEEESMISVDVLSKELGKSASFVRKIMSQIEENEYHFFPRDENKFMLYENDKLILNKLFEQKETYEGTWTELLKLYFVGE